MIFAIIKSIFERFYYKIRDLFIRSYSRMYRNRDTGWIEFREISFFKYYFLIIKQKLWFIQWTELEKDELTGDIYDIEISGPFYKHPAIQGIYRKIIHWPPIHSLIYEWKMWLEITIVLILNYYWWVYIIELSYTK